MAEPSFKFKVVTPNEVFFEGEAVSVVAPGVLGYLGILKNHAPFITTIGEGETTAERELRAISLNYVNRSVSIQTGFGLETFLSRDLSTVANDFRATMAPALRQLFIDQISRRP